MSINLLALEIDRALAVLQAATADQTFTWQGIDYPCVPHQSELHLMFGAGGFTPDSSLELDVRNGVLPDPPPAPPQFLTFHEKRYRIIRVVTNPDLSIRIYCNDPERGAGIREREM